MNEPRSAMKGGGWLLFVAFGVLIVACPRARSDGAASDAGAASATSGLSPWASNAFDVTRFADEVPLGPDATIAHDNTAVRSSPGTGDVVATLSSGAETIKIATRGHDTLIAFDDPKGGGGHLMGWVPESAVEEAAPTTPPPPPAGDDGGSWSDDAGPPSPSHPGRHHHHPRPQR